MGKFDCLSAARRPASTHPTGSDPCSVCAKKVVDAGMASPWVCVSGLEKLNKEVKQNKAKIGVMEGRVDTPDTELVTLKCENAFKRG